MTPFLALIPITGAVLAGDIPPVEVEYFFEPGCPACAVVEREVLAPLGASYGGCLDLRRRSIGDASNFLALAAYQERLDMDPHASVSVVVDRRHALAGLPAIRDGLAVRVALAVDARLGAEAGGVPFVLPPPVPSAVQEDVEARVRRFTPGVVAIAGLADGLNPCAFTTVVFLTSLLATGGRKGRTVFLGGAAFCMASFGTYFLIGTGMLAVLRQATGHFTGLRLAVERGTALLLAVLGVLSLRDAWRYGRTGDARSVSLQLPDGIKRRIRSFARARWAGPAVFGTGLLCGAGVTLLESVCTGQLYLPTLVYMVRERGGTRCLGLLAAYNLAFVLPLVMVFLLGAAGVRSQRLADWTRHHVVPSKLLLAAVFLTLAVLLAVQATPSLVKR